MEKPGTSILCVDDDPNMREILYVIISRLGHNTITAVDGIDALEKLAAGHVDIVVTDLDMPRMDGIELIKKIKTDFDDVDIIFITAYEIKYKYTDILALGATDFIPKPFKANQLEAKLTMILRERKLRAELKRLTTND